MKTIGRSIRSQLIAIILLVSASALAAGMFSIGFTYYQTTYSSLVADAKNQASLLAHNIKVPMSLGDESTIQQALESLILNDSFGAAVFDETGKIIARRDGSESRLAVAESEFSISELTHHRDGLLLAWMPVREFDDETIGVILLKISTDNFNMRVNSLISTSILICLILLILVYVISLRLQRFISEPLVQLDQISRKVGESNDYSIRVPRFGENEIGSLGLSFNRMLETIERNQTERDSANAALQLNEKRLERAVKDLQYLANYDSLTKLPNRVLCMDRIRYSLLRAVRTNSIVAILFLDLDHFKDINDSLGHAVGDQLLQSTSQRLLGKLREEDTLARLGGDEFVIILNDIHDTEDVINIVEKIVTSFEEPFQLSSYEVNTSVSVGVCMFPNDGSDVDSLMKAADAAMYKAKEVGRNTFEFYEAELNQIAIRRHQIANELRYAIKNDELFIVLQPQFNLHQKKVIGAEVLLRWNHPVMGFVSPAEFVPVAENTGLIKEIGNWVLEQACAKISDCLQKGFEIRLAVNLSALQFRQSDLAEQISATMHKYKVPTQYLEVEIVESMLMRDVEQAIDILERLKAMQIRIAIDDFGTGYSSLSYLRRFPLDALKVDRSFIDELVVNSDDTAITLAIISMAKSLRLEVVAEGVETAEQLAFLASNNCDDIQGYYFAKPLVYDEFLKFLSSQPSL